ncbi:MAG: FtsX-like permease family protein [Coriobacteriia bacterium]
MNPLGSAVRDASRSPARSGFVAGSAAVVAALGIAALLLSSGTQAGLARASDRLGADILVAPLYSVERIDNALMLGLPVDETLPLGLMPEVASVEGVAAVTPQLYMTSLPGTPCCPEVTTPIVAFDPETDFALAPWLDQMDIGELGIDDVVGGARVFLSEGTDALTIYGHPFQLVGNLDHTGTSLDRSVYMTFAAAEAMAVASGEDAVQPLEYEHGRVSAVLVRVDEKADPLEVARAIDASVDGVDAFAGDQLFRSMRTQAALVERALLAVFAVVGVLCLVLVVVAAMMAARERRRETGVLRALGATRSRVLGAFALEAAVLAVMGSMVGALAGAGIVYLYRDYIASSVAIALELPTLAGFAGVAALVTAGAAILVMSAYVVPLLPSCLDEPAHAMRER